MSVTAANAGWAPMQAATKYAAVCFAKVIFIEISCES